MDYDKPARDSHSYIYSAVGIVVLVELLAIAAVWWWLP